MRAHLQFAMVLGTAVRCFAADPPDDWSSVNSAGVASYMAGDHARAIASFEKCWSLAQTPTERARTAANQANVLHALARDREAYSWYQRAFDLWLQIPSGKNGLSEVSLGLADTERGLNDVPAAERTIRRAIDLQPASEYLAALKVSLSDILREYGRNEESRIQLLEASRLPDISPSRTLEILLAMADLDRLAMRWDESNAAWQSALILARQTGSVQSEAYALGGQGLTALNQGDMANAEAALKRSLTLFEKPGVASRQQLANALHCVGSVYLANHKYALAKEALLRGLNTLEPAGKAGSTPAAMIKGTLAEVYAGEKRLDDARRYAAEAWEYMRRTLGENSAVAAQALGTVAWVEQQSHDLAAAASSYQLAINILRSTQAAGDQRMIFLMGRYASVLSSLHRDREAKQVRTAVKAFAVR